MRVENIGRKSQKILCSINRQTNKESKANKIKPNSKQNKKSRLWTKNGKDRS